tara:strand:- start:239 stop:541 length:303 start_codon:yes stop_codon:yes gene_type:complete
MNINGYGDKYTIYQNGQIINNKLNHKFKITDRINLKYDNEKDSHKKTLTRLLVEHFKPLEFLPEGIIIYIDGNKTNIKINNLTMVSKTEYKKILKLKTKN